MNTSELKSLFFKTLDGIYPSMEIQSFFFILSEKHLDLSRLDFSLNTDIAISKENKRAFEAASIRLKNYEPIQYILGETEFYGLPFKVNNFTLIPRPETEELVDWIIDEVKTQEPEPRTLLDIGTGSGCIAISLAKNLPHYVVSGVDISEGALEVAQQNAILNNTNVQFDQLDILTIDKLSERYDIIVSNPPYVRELEKKQMQPNVLKYEPSSALFVSDIDPLLFYEKIAGLSMFSLNSRGELYFEINEYLSKELVSLLEKIGFIDIKIKKDIFGKDRMIKCTKNE